jgi:uncharacterized protein (TIGR03067 family)
MIYSSDKSEMAYRIDPTITPRTLELLENGKVIAKAIYELKGDDLKICLGRKPDAGEPKAPADFDINKAKSGSFPTLMVMKRQGEKKENPGDGKPQTDQERIKGTWLLTAGERYGFQFDEDQLDREPEFTFTADRLEMKRKEIQGQKESRLQFTYKILPGEQPKVIALTFDDGPAKGKAFRGIYAFEGENLKLCMDMFDGNEPKTFAGPKGTQFTLYELERKEKRERDDANGKLREAKARQLTEKSLHDIGIAFHNYHNDYNRLPSATICDANGQPLLSWRVTVLPWVGQDNLWKFFKIDEPWDSEHNKKLIPMMPKIFAPRMSKTADPFTTYYRVFHGTGAAFEGTKGLHLARDFPDGISTTILVVEAGEAVPWTKPDELEYDPAKPLPKLGGQFKDGFYMVMADGSKHFVQSKFDEKVFRCLITRNDGKDVSVNDLKK